MERTSLVKKRFQNLGVESDSCGIIGGGIDGGEIGF
ncbi:Uncharacterised protein [uncultured archaeon]|nr:Uncharacterised protein [uncultured archaeon]